MVAVSCAASRRHSFRARGTLLLAFVLAASGCASSGPKRPWTHKDKVDAAAGAVGAASTVCGPFFFICALPPLLVVVGVGKLTEPSDSVPKLTQSKGTTFITRLPSSDFSPSGFLLIDEDTVTVNDEHDVSGTLVLNLDDPLADSTQSIKEDIVVACTTGDVSFLWRYSYDGRTGSGSRITSDPASVEIPPGPELDAVKHAFCKFDSDG